MLALDSHALLWWVSDDRRMGRKTTSRISASQQGTLAISVITWYELSNLSGGKHLKVRDEIHDVRRTLSANGLVEIDLSAAMAFGAAGLLGLRDPMDRFIVAAARCADGELVTADAEILSWEGKVDRIDATE